MGRRIRKRLMIGDKSWAIVINPRLRKHWGLTLWDDREIHIAPHTDPRLLDDTIIHELSHALMPWGSERFITAFARAVSATCCFLPHDDNPMAEAVDLLLPNCTSEFAESVAATMRTGWTIAHQLNPC